MPAPSTIVLMPEGVRIPSSIANLASFREWALYYRAGVREYWLVDARFAEIAFTIHHWTPDGYRVAVGAEGFSPSLVLERSFRLVRRAHPHRIGLFRLEDRALPSDTVG